MIDMDRMNLLTRAAVQGFDPGELTDDERAEFAAIQAEIAANPGRVYAPSPD